MWELDHKEGRAPKNWCFHIVVLERSLESPLDSKEIKPVNPKGKQLWIFIGRMDAEAEAPILWPPDANSQFIGKDPDAWKDWGQEEKGMTESEMVGWQHWLNGHEFEQTLGDSEGLGSLACCSPWVAKSWPQLSDWTTRVLIDLSWCMPGRANLINSGNCVSLYLKTIPETRVSKRWKSLISFYYVHHLFIIKVASHIFLLTCICMRRRQWHPTPVLLPGKSHGWRRLVGCSPCGR